MEELINSKIDFAPIEILSSDKTTGWIGSDCIRTCKFMPCVFRYADRFFERKNQDNININNCNAKRCKNYLLMRNLKVPSKIKDKREAVINHMQSIKDEIKDNCNMSFQPVIHSLCKLVANLMTAVDSKESKLSAHCKQDLNSFHKMGAVIKKLTNDKSDTPKIVSMRNNLNVGGVINDADEHGPIRFTQEGNWHGEKGIQAVKEQFISQKGNFGAILINKMHAKKNLHHLSPEDSIEYEIPTKFRNYCIDSIDDLNDKLDSAVPVPFIMTKDGALVFVFRHNEAIEFKFSDLIDIQMSWFYFNIYRLRSVPNPLLKLEHENAAIKCVLLPSISHSGKTCCTPISNDWLTLDKSGEFKACSNLKLDIKYPINQISNMCYINLSSFI